MMRMLFGFLLAIGVALCVGAIHAEDPPSVEYISPASFLDRAKLPDFLPYASDFMASYPKDSRTPQVLMDCWTVATALQNKAAADQAKTRLLLEFPNSLPTLFLMRSHKPEEMRELLSKRFEDSKQPLSRLTMFRIVRAYQSHNATFGISTDDMFNAQLALALQNADSAQRFKSLLSGKDEVSVKLVNLACDKSLSVKEKAETLHQINHATAKAYLSYFLREEISDEDRNLPELKEIAIQLLLDESNYSEALIEIKALRESSPAARVLYWQAIAEGATGDFSNACSTLTELRKTYPKSEWAQNAQRLEEAFSNVDESIAAQIQLAEKTMDTFLSSKINLIEMTLHWQPEKSEPIAIYAGLDIQKDGCEIIASRAAKTLFGYQANSEGSKVYVHGDKVIHRYDKDAMCPLIEMKVTPATSPNTTGSFYFNWRMVKQGHSSLRSSLHNILSLSELRDLKRCEPALRQALERGYFPESIKQDNGEFVLTWVHPNSKSPELAISEVRIDANFKFRSFKFDKTWQVTDVFYGNAPQEARSKQLWPKIAEERSEKMGEGDMLRYFSSALAFFADEYSSTAKTTDREKQTK
ncbi:MAG: tetratricopeptide repeat protein [Planctomycetaceae bacterium]